MKRIECRTCGTKLTSYNNSCSLCGGHEYVGIGLNKEEKMSRKNLVDYLIDDAAWKTKARAAGWSPPVKSRLRVVEKCPDHKVQEVWDKEMAVGLIECPTCHKSHGQVGTITRLLSPEEMVWLLEALFEERADPEIPIILKKGVKVVME